MYQVGQNSFIQKARLPQTATHYTLSINAADTDDRTSLQKRHRNRQDKYNISRLYKNSPGSLQT